MISTNNSVNCIDIKTFFNENQNMIDMNSEKTDVLINPYVSAPVVWLSCWMWWMSATICANVDQRGISLIVINGCISDCLQDYRPVCAINGQTFPNQCYAKCNGFSDEEYVSERCESIVDCVKCTENQRCIKKSQVCLTSDQCPQYECISSPIDCQLFGTNPVCDTNGLNHQNLCWLLKKRQNFIAPIPDPCVQ
ncbi:unnamed protein product [Oppiella nova]|uniref:Kazal-like domain-containing protein n=1 Tax=Oppiella nova TaxID=334625 RepID=A0A7R9QZ90_9ACAR|nr:unnamed protein product [Oppiella nova]CAG2179913.1 unnamed protein product [Oppiella nova]